MYLLHFERAYKGCSRHYIGFTRDLERRLEDHRQGTACATTKTAFDRGIGFTVARTWPGTARLKRQIQQRGSIKSCPICQASSA